MKNAFIVVAIALLASSAIRAQEIPEPTWDYKFVTTGNVKQIIHNTGVLNEHTDRMDLTKYPYDYRMNSEHPIGSGYDHVTTIGLRIGAIVNGQRLATYGSGERTVEWAPSAEPWDTIWTVGKGDTVDIPYWQDYVGVSDMDYICHYNDHNEFSRNLPQHVPINVDVIQQLHSWTGDKLGETMIVNFYVIFNQKVNEVVFSMYFNNNLGRKSYPAWGYDDELHFVADHNMMCGFDTPILPDGNASALGLPIIPPPKTGDPLGWTFQWFDVDQNGLDENQKNDNDLYLYWATTNEIRQDQICVEQGSKGWVSWGEYPSYEAGDTALITMGMVFSDPELTDNDEKKQDLVKKWLEIKSLRASNYKIPSSPPAPEVRVTTADGKIHLDWTPRSQEEDPRYFVDEVRAGSDNDTMPFEGYRLYKYVPDPRIEGQAVNWSLQGDYDLKNGYGQDLGLQYEFEDEGLLNNFTYYYTVTSYARADSIKQFYDLESSKNENELEVIPGTAPPEKPGIVRVVPNPYRGDIAYEKYVPQWEEYPKTREWSEVDRRIQFVNLPRECTIKIYTVAGQLVETIEHYEPPTSQIGYENWNLTSSSGQTVSSGIYLFTVEGKQGDAQIGKFVIIK